MNGDGREEEDQDRPQHVLGDVTASDYELDDRRCLPDLPARVLPTPPPQKFQEEEEQATAGPLLLFTSSEEAGRTELGAKARASCDGSGGSVSAVSPLAEVLWATETTPVTLQPSGRTPTNAAVADAGPNRLTLTEEAFGPGSSRAGTPQAPLPPNELGILTELPPPPRAGEEEAAPPWSPCCSLRPPPLGDVSPAASPSLNTSRHSSDTGTSALDYVDWPAESDLSDGWTRPSSPFQPVAPTTENPTFDGATSALNPACTGAPRLGVSLNRGATSPQVPTSKTGHDTSTERGREPTKIGLAGGAETMSRTVSIESDDASDWSRAPPSESSDDASWTRVSAFSSSGRSVRSACPSDGDAAEREDDFDYVA